MSAVTTTDVLIAGGGLSGCLVAQSLCSQGIDCRLVEPRDRLGGRILSCKPEPGDVTAGAVDLGPSWFWPHQQGLIKVLKMLHLEHAVYEQSHRGDSVIEYAGGQLERRAGGVSMAGSYRLAGGMAALIEHLSQSVPESCIQLNTRLVSWAQQSQSLTVNVRSAQGEESIHCRSLVLAMPPRVVAASIDWPGKNTALTRALESVPTWMATEAKITLLYKEPFWLSQGLSGDAMSQIGPMAEIHDATPRGSTQGALFGFISNRPPQRIDREASLKTESVQQVQRLFNTAQKPEQVLLKDWTTDPLTATAIDHTGQRAHPSGAALTQLLPEQVFWSVSEVATQDAGYLEGAVQAAHAAVKQLTDNRQTDKR